MFMHWTQHKQSGAMPHASNRSQQTALMQSSHRLSPGSGAHVVPPPAPLLALDEAEAELEALALAEADEADVEPPAEDVELPVEDIELPVEDVEPPAEDVEPPADDVELEETSEPPAPEPAPVAAP
jgi:hypothetical protein